MVASERARERKVTARLTELKDTVGQLRQKPLTVPPRYTEILKSVSTNTPHNGSARYSLASPLVIWKISTAFIHGSGQLVHALSDFRQVTEFQDGVATVEVKPSVQMLAGALSATVNLITRGDQRFTYLATHDYAGRTVSTG